MERGITVRASTSIENVAITQGQSSIGASREPGSIDCASLGRSVELELTVISNIPNTSEDVGQDTSLKGDPEWGAILAGFEDRAFLRSSDPAVNDLSYSTSGPSCTRSRDRSRTCRRHTWPSGFAEGYTIISQITTMIQSPRFQVPNKASASRNLWGPGFQLWNYLNLP